MEYLEYLRQQNAALAAQVDGIKDEISDFCAALDGMLLADLSSEQIADDLEQRLSNYEVQQQHIDGIRADAVLRFSRHVLAKYRYDVSDWANQYAESIQKGEVK